MSVDVGGIGLRRDWLTFLFIAAIFIGSVWLVKITLPISILMLPLFFIDRSQISLRLPIAAVPLLVIGAIIACQFVLNHGNPAFKWKSDLAVWLPVVFAGMTIVALRNRGIGERSSSRAMIAGGAVTSVVMLGMILFVPKGMFLLPGQNATEVENAYAERQKSLPVPTEDEADAGRPAHTVAPAGREAFVPDASPGDQAFYDLKNRARNALGVSNYIAVFLVFLVAISLFSRHPAAAVAFGALTLVTLSRFGIIVLGLVVVIYLLRKRIEPTKAAIGAAILIGVGLAGLYLLRQELPPLPGSASLLARLEYWQSGINAFALHPVIGSPRSVLLVEMGNSITWNPHNCLLWAAVNFGLVGLVAYCGYAFIVLREVWIASRSSSLWTGVFVGLMMMMAWGLEEIVVLTPAFEVLFAAMYALARNKNVASPPN
ncbi:O-antigen ligase family protein [Mesorhizobium sp. B1-1-7]|uniref:O-antigen ligase family protein n=1 Tax=Mesorhizobium sp. B1-1-7 TaxID=2589977 RepID=UPI001128D761|nr:O-antigen ligase family protein [Mesorhizobium sp. B1-1-7]TPN57175.1 O-antigen ligase family protein [Mesorhizobium sp. B1-1-7]